MFLLGRWYLVTKVPPSVLWVNTSDWLGATLTAFLDLALETGLEPSLFLNLFFDVCALWARLERPLCPLGTLPMLLFLLFLPFFYSELPTPYF